MARLFGTDGVRGLANRDITAELALALGSAAARYVSGNAQGQERKLRAVIGRDSRISGEFLDHAIAAGLASAGMDVTRVGVVPTPAVAHLTAKADVELGVMISASHNPMPDNGIKFFARGGFKLPDQVEDDIERILGTPWLPPTGDKVGEIVKDPAISERKYLDHLISSCKVNLQGLRIAVDCANGAASEVGPEALREAGADVVVINAAPDGRNINYRCGSTHPEQLQAAVVASGADFGVAFDGDADRCLAVDNTGEMVDGDKIMGVLATGFADEGRLAHNTLVVTVMSNLGLILAMKERGIETVQTGVGDRYVLESMLENGYSLGGEQSGHVIASEFATTGDGVLTALLLAEQVKKTGTPLRELGSFVNRLPQVLINVPGVDREACGTDAGLQAAIKKAEGQLGQTGRVLLRPSGTEPLVRVMVEAKSHEEAQAVAQTLAQEVQTRLSL